MTVAGRIVGACVSIIGIGTLALFSGLITVGFLDQLKIYREQHPKAVTITKNTITVQQTYSSVVVTPEVAAAAALPSQCPHCGSMLSYPALRESGEALGA